MNKEQIQGFKTKLFGFFFSINDSNPSMYDVMSMKLLETPTEQNIDWKLKDVPELVLDTFLPILVPINVPKQPILVFNSNLFLDGTVVFEIGMEMLFCVTKKFVNIGNLKVLEFIKEDEFPFISINQIVFNDPDNNSCQLWRIDN